MYKHQLKNQLDLSEGEFRELRRDFEQQNRSGKERSFTVRLARWGGYLLLAAATLLLLQTFYFPYGPDLTRIVRLFPAAGTVLVIIIAFGLFTSIRSIKKKKAQPSQRPGYRDPESRDDCQDHLKTGSEPPPDSGDEHRARNNTEYDSWAFKTRKRWYRSRSEKMLFGVCGGISGRLEIDPTIIRALFALAFFSYGISFLIYIVLAILLPREPLKAT